jgi:hypothetical protein
MPSDLISISLRVKQAAFGSQLSAFGPGNEAALFYHIVDLSREQL